jgi:short-subunit dehydrogenase
MTKIALVIGSSGGIGSAVCQSLQSKYTVISIDRNKIDFSQDNYYDKISKELINHNPDLIVNCAGHFGDNTETHHKTMDLNFGSNWAILKHYIANKPNKNIRFIMIGSSAYREGRRSYMLYAASKAALYNLWLSVKEYFENTNLSVVLINPVKTKTRMMNPASTTYIMPEDVADLILSTSLGSEHECIDMSYKELHND